MGGAKKNPLSLGTVCAIDRSPLFPFPRPVSLSLSPVLLPNSFTKAIFSPDIIHTTRSILSGLRVLRRFDKLRSLVFSFSLLFSFYESDNFEFVFRLRSN